MTLSTPNAHLIVQEILGMKPSTQLRSTAPSRRDVLRGMAQAGSGLALAPLDDRLRTD